MVCIFQGKKFLTMFTVLFLLSLVLTSRALLVISFVPLFIYFLGASLSLPRIEIKKVSLKNSALIGEDIYVEITGKISGGVGTLILYEELPKHFELVDGTNYKVLWKGFGTRNFSFFYKVRCTKRGNYYFKGIEWEFIPFLGLKQPIKGIITESHELTVRPRILNVHKIRIPHKISFVSTPLQGIARLGSLSTNFREIRQYAPGDPFKLINWKATARMSTRIVDFPLMNEYEREGKLSAWIFLDAHYDMRLGTSIENALEFGIEAAINLAHFFLSKGFLLGMYIYNNMEEKFYPDIGKQHFIKIANRLLKLYSVENKLQIHRVEGLSAAIEKNRMLITNFSPLIVIITHITQNNVKEIIYALKKVSLYIKRKCGAKLVVINILPYDIIPKKNCLEEFSGLILEAESKRLSKQLCGLNIAVLNWNPNKENFGSLLIKHLRPLVPQ